MQQTQAPQTNPPLGPQPYGDANAPAYPPPGGGKIPGRMACVVWGVVLICFGVLGAFNSLGNVVTAMGFTMDTTSWVPGMDEDVRRATQEMSEKMVAASLARWSFWASLVVEFTLMVLSIVAGVMLLKAKRIAWKAALARAFVAVCLSLPIGAIEAYSISDTTIEAQQSIMEVQVKKATARKNERKNASNQPDNAPMPANDSSEAQREQMQEMMSMTNKFTRVTMFAMLIITSFFVLGINGLMAFQLTRPKVKSYLANAKQRDADYIPGYDPSMGLIGPAMAPPAPNQPPNANQPPHAGPPPDQPPPNA